MTGQLYLRTTKQDSQVLLQLTTWLDAIDQENGRCRLYFDAVKQRKTVAVTVELHTKKSIVAT